MKLPFAQRTLNALWTVGAALAVLLISISMHAHWTTEESGRAPASNSANNSDGTTPGATLPSIHK